MRPSRSSEDLCPRRRGEERAALVVRLMVGSDGRKRSHSFHRVLMRSTARLNYVQAQAAIDGWPDDASGPLLASVLEPLYLAYRALNHPRDRPAPPALDLPDRRTRLPAPNPVARARSPGPRTAH